MAKSGDKSKNGSLEETLERYRDYYDKNTAEWVFQEGDYKDIDDGVPRVALFIGGPGPPPGGPQDALGDRAPRPGPEPLPPRRHPRSGRADPRRHAPDPQGPRRDARLSDRAPLPLLGLRGPGGE